MIGVYPYIIIYEKANGVYFDYPSVVACILCVSHIEATVDGGQHMKVVLSRKGFDSSAGGYPSPHLVDSGRLISFPIPEDEKVNTGVSYSDLRVDQNQSYFET